MGYNHISDIDHIYLFTHGSFLSVHDFQTNQHLLQKNNLHHPFFLNQFIADPAYGIHRSP
jgi:hypothetical protein